MKVELIPIPTKITEASIKQYLADCSSVVRNKQPKDNDRLYDRLLKESFGNKASRVFEYIPCNLNVQDIPNRTTTLIQLFGFSIEDRYYTTARELLNWGWSLDTILPFIDFTNYRAVKVTAPYFLYGQASTHNQITSVSHSNRYTQSKLGYWCPPEVRTFWGNESVETCQDAWNDVVPNSTSNYLQTFMKEVGIKRREVFARGSDMLQNRVYTLGGYIQPNGWIHFLKQRGLDPHTQLEMRILADLIGNQVLGTNWKESLSIYCCFLFQ